MSWFRALADRNTLLWFCVNVSSPYWCRITERTDIWRNSDGSQLSPEECNLLKTLLRHSASGHVYVRLEFVWLSPAGMRMADQALKVGMPG